MESVDTVQQYAELTKAVKKKYGSYLYNAMLMPSQVSQFIGESKLYYIPREEGILFLCNEKDFYKGYFFIKEDVDTMEVEKMNKPLIVEFVISNRTIVPVEQMEHRIRQANFELYVENIRTVVELDQQVLPERTSDFFITWAGSSEKEQIYSMWEQLDPYDSIIPREKVYDKMGEDKELLCLKRGNTVCGALRLKEENKNTGSIWLVAVNPSMQGAGVGRQLYVAAMEAGIKRGYKRLWQWADRKNQRVLKTVGQLGFIFDGTVSREYILTQ